MASTEKTLLSCKKCGEFHEKPINSKCDRAKLKDEKRDTSHENTGKKTPRAKPHTEQANQDKMLELVMQTMTGFSDKLSAMEAKITGLASGSVKTTDNASGARQSRSREKVKRSGLFQTDESETTLFSPSMPGADGNENTAYTQTFADTAVIVKQTPARAKKQKPDLDLGVAPLQSGTPQLGRDQTTVTRVSLPRVMSTVSKPPGITSIAWANDVSVATTMATDKPTNMDMNFNLTDQFGNPVQIKGIGPTVHNTQPITVTRQAEPLFTQPQGETPTQTIDFLRANPYIQRMVEERVSVLEARMKSEMAQGNNSSRKKSGRYNISETSCAPVHLRWPNESCLTGATRKRTAYDDLTLGQFVVGFLNNVLDTANPQVARAMLTELAETVKLSENLSWQIARGAFAVAMHRIEDETASWTDTRLLAENRLTFSQTAVFNGSITMSPRTSQTQPAAAPKRIVCRWYNEGTCPHTQDHGDTSGATLFRHVCMFCYKTLKRNNGHPESECMNKKKQGE